MKSLFRLCLLLCIGFSSYAQNLTPELLWKLKRVGGVEVAPNGKTILFGVTSYDISKNKGNRELYTYDLSNGKSTQITQTPESEYNAIWTPNGKKIGFLKSTDNGMQIFEMDPNGQNIKQVSKIQGGINGFKYSPDGESVLFNADVKLDQTINEKYPDLPKANVHVFDDLMYRHWNQWHDYSYSHIFYSTRSNGLFIESKDIMENEKFDSPLNPFGGLEQVAWGTKGQSILYTCKKLSGKEYAVSTNSDIYSFDLQSGTTRNLTEGRMGYDMVPVFSAENKMAFLSMDEPGFESDKNDIILYNLNTNETTNITADIDLTVSTFIWGPDPHIIYFEAVKDATNQLFELNIKTKKHRQITTGRHNYTSLALAGDKIIATRQSMKGPNEIYLVDPASGSDKPITTFNKEILDGLGQVTIEQRMVKTSDGKDMLTWVIFPPNFDKIKKYPTILYCQGGPQSAVSQFFSFRWNFNLMASQGYIIVAPNRRGLPGFGQEWNDQISGDWGGQAMKDYLAAIDEVSKESYVDKDKRGCIGASYGGYSAYYLAGIHEGRFSCFISHCGLFNLESWYGSTEELFFANKDIGGPYWGKDRAISYDKYSPHLHVDKWDTPILVIHGEKDFRVPVTQGMEAFQAAQLKGIPSKFLYFPTEGHWVQGPQNGLVWHREFFSWLDKWLK